MSSGDTPTRMMCAVTPLRSLNLCECDDVARKNDFCVCVFITAANRLHASLTLWKLVVWNQVLDHFLPPLLEAVLGDYESNIPLARDAEVLVTMQKIVTKLGVDITGQVGSSRLHVRAYIELFVRLMRVCVCVLRCPSISHSLTRSLSVFQHPQPCCDFR